VDSLLSGLAGLFGPGRFTGGRNDVRVSILADSKSTGAFSVESVPVVSSGVSSLSLDVFPETHIVRASLVVSNDQKVTGRSSSNVHGFAFEVDPVVSALFVAGRLPNFTTLANDSGLTVVFDSDSVSVARGVSVGVELAIVEESDFTSAVDNPDLSVGANANINSLHQVGFPLGVFESEGIYDSGFSDGEDCALGADGNSVGVLKTSLLFPSKSAGGLFVDVTVFTSDENVLGHVDSNIRGSRLEGSVFPCDLVLVLALLASLESVSVV